MNYEIVDPFECWIEIDPAIKATAWQNSHKIDVALGSQMLIYLNSICYHTCLPWLQSEHTKAINPWSRYSNSPLWPLLNGTALTWGDKQIVLLPSEKFDDVEVPQEWVDIPSFAADYYLAVQVNPSELWVRIWGYATHSQIKAGAVYDSTYRNYYLDSKNIHNSFNSFQVELELGLDNTTHYQVDALPSLSRAQSESLVDRLSKQNIVFPRLAIPFPLWGALLEDEVWSNRLAERRKSSSSKSHSDTVTNLRQWFQSTISDGWQSLENWAAPGQYLVAANVRDSTFDTPGIFQRFKELSIVSESGNEIQVVLSVTLSPEESDRIAIQVQLYPKAPDTYLPNNLKLTLLSVDETALQSAQVSIDETYFIQLRRFKCSAGTRFSLNINLINSITTETFIV